MTIASPIAIKEIILQVDASGAPVRLEYVRGRTKWETSPTSRHQITLREIGLSIRVQRCLPPPPPTVSRQAALAN